MKPPSGDQTGLEETESTSRTGAPPSTGTLNRRRRAVPGTDRDPPPVRRPRRRAAHVERLGKRPDAGAVRVAQWSVERPPRARESTPRRRPATRRPRRPPPRAPALQISAGLVPVSRQTRRRRRAKPDRAARSRVRSAARRSARSAARPADASLLGGDVACDRTVQSRTLGFETVATRRRGAPGAGARRDREVVLDARAQANGDPIAQVHGVQPRAGAVVRGRGVEQRAVVDANG